MRKRERILIFGLVLIFIAASAAVLSLISYRVELVSGYISISKEEVSDLEAMLPENYSRISYTNDLLVIQNVKAVGVAAWYSLSPEAVVRIEVARFPNPASADFAFRSLKEFLSDFSVSRYDGTSVFSGGEIVVVYRRLGPNVAALGVGPEKYLPWIRENLPAE